MISIFLLLLFYDRCNYDLSPKIGTEHFIYNSNEDELICINITVYPFIIIFNEFDENSIFQQFSSQYNLSDLFIKSESLLRFFPIYQYFESPFDVIVIKTPTATKISFTTVSFPGICQNGIYISNYLIDSLSFSNDGDDFFKLNVYDDKCIVYSTEFLQTVKIEMQSNDNEDQVFIYHSFEEFISINGNSSTEITSKNEKYPLIIRIVADEENPPTSIKIDFSTSITSSPTNFQPRCDFYLPASKIEKCPDLDTWYTEKTAILVVVSTCGSFLILMFVISSENLTKFFTGTNSNNTGSSPREFHSTLNTYNSSQQNSMFNEIN
ncbi:hypothetical protein TRFO_17153 [Tritrichomonas foetus]|uniref:Uncharacterized protein n=1 Tax=Tritrichomonas foetus TaxID=1144522 RepID=A0A1J4KP51_9EUKA|nr:hypothetical protein TRFO_17153 [Tritrichomonas foetus]|eukprot:OHT12882.1 hypothetical protein TRFO_17153 [Tritrichomonas foetus]